MHSSMTLRPRLTALALSLALAAATAAAQGDAPRRYDLPAQPLNATLARIAGESGARVSVDAELARGVTAAAVQGAFTPEQALRQALAGTALELVRTGGGGLTVRRAAAEAPAPAASPADTVRLREVTVTAEADRSGTTEGTGAYTAQSSSVGSKTGQSLREVPQSVSVVARQQIEDMALTTLPDVLKAMPGVTSFQGSMLADRSLSRGFEMGELNMRVDGGAALSRGFGIDNDMAFYDRVEVLRGADGLFGGNGEPGGVTNLVRKRPTREKQVIVQGQYGSDNFKRGDIDVSGPLNDAGSLRGRAVLAHEDKDFFFDVAKSRRTLAYGILEADLARGTTVALGGSYSRRDSSYQGYGLPRARTGEDLGLPRTLYLSGADDRANKDITSVFAQLAHRFGSDWRLDVHLNHDRAEQDRYDHYFNGAADLATGAGTVGGSNLQHESWRNTAIDAALKGSFGLMGRRHDVMVGADWSRFDNRSTLARPVPYVMVAVPDIYAFDPYAYRQSSAAMVPWQRQRPLTQQSGVYGSVRFQVSDPLHIIAGGRLSRYHYSFQSSRLDTSGAATSNATTEYRDNSVFTPYLAATYKLDETWTTYASVAETFKSQASNMAGPAPGTPLDPVTGRNVELGVKGEHLNGRLHSAFALYRIERSGAAVRDTTYPASSGSLGSSCCYVGMGEIVSKGFEAELSGEVLPDLQLSASYSYNDNRNKNANNVRYNGVNPRNLFKFFGAYRLPGEHSRWKFGGGATVQSKTFVDDYAYVRNADGTVGSTTTNYRIGQGGYAIASAFVEYRIDAHWTAALNVNNLFDKTYYSTIGYLDYGSFYGAPRNAMLTLRGKF
ncbi:TonB-dependent siderophore receptor [Pseudorhodoferax sp. LjRoot39]|uniref:TonB-dependent siderophore receptor n=1 Tax=Pseudorhodoferax sp. LjRoot39 TaxID=3342328 RepID=UPI003ECD9F2F